MKKTKFQTEYKTLELRIKENTGINRARIYIIVGLVIAIIKLGRVNLKKLAPLINPKRSDRTNYRRLNKFFEQFSFDKKGNSNYQERSKIIEDFIEVFGLEKIEVLVADRAPQGHFLRAIYR